MDRHSDTALLIINYGTPRSSSRRDVARYLRVLLDNNHLMTMNRVGRWVLVNCIIAPFRSGRSSKLYARLSKGGEMPLNTHTRDFAAKLQSRLGSRADVHTAMTSGDNYVKDVIAKVLEMNYSRIVVAPMFPQCTESTWGASLDALFKALCGGLNVPPVRVIEPFYDDGHYLEAVCGIVAEQMRLMPDYERIVCSYHGIPVKHTQIAHPGHTCQELGCGSHVDGSNYKCYLAQCNEQTRRMAKILGVPEEKCLTTFQSRLTDRWIQPFTDTEVRRLAAEGVKKLIVATPSFTVDCLETIVEIDSTLRETFMQCGGEKFATAPCLNSSDVWVDNFCKILEKSF